MTCMSIKMLQLIVACFHADIATSEWSGSMLTTHQTHMRTRHARDEFCTMFPELHALRFSVCVTKVYDTNTASLHLDTDAHRHIISVVKLKQRCHETSTEAV